MSLFKIRLLPLTIFFASLMLTVRVGDIWRGVDGMLSGAIVVAGADAQQSGAQQSGDATSQDGGTQGMTPAPDPTKVPTKVPGETKTQGRENVAKDPTLLTQAEIDILQQLAERREALESLEQELDMRSGLLVAAEARIDKKVEELKILQATIQDLIKGYDKQQEEKMISLVKIYEAMKPKDAARIFEELDIDTLLSVAERMKERKLAPIMASMNPERAKEMTVELSRLRELPY